LCHHRQSLIFAIYIIYISVCVRYLEELTRSSSQLRFWS
jgi:hypothetical protein